MTQQTQTRRETERHTHTQTNTQERQRERLTATMQVNQKNSDTNLDQKLQLEKAHGEHGGMIQMEEDEREEGNTQTNNRLPIYHLHHQKT